MPNPLKAAVIGVGHLGKEHARIYAQMKNVQLVAVVDTNEVQVNTIAKRWDTRGLTDYHSLLGEVEAVSIVSPTSTHFEIARDFLQARTHVLLEKPMTNSLETAQKLVQIAQEMKCKLQVGHIERFNPALIEILKRNIRPVYIEAMRIGPFRFRSGDIGVVLDLMIHDIDILNLLTKSTVEKVDAVGINLLGNYEDIANARITFSCGCVANVTASRAALKALR
jgi:predicted dehydrogenase